MKKIYLFAAIMAIVTAISVYTFASGINKGGDKNVVTITVVAAKSAVPENTPITEDMLQTVTMPLSTVTSGMVRNTADAVGRVSPYPLTAGECLYTSKLITLGDKAQTGLSYALEKGKRAITIRVDDINGVGYFIKDGDFIDIMTSGMAKDLGNIPVTAMLLEKIKVLKVGNQATPAGSDYTTLTLSVTPLEAEKLIYCYTNAKLTCILRPTGDNKIVNPIIMGKLLDPSSK